MMNTTVTKATKVHLEKIVKNFSASLEEVTIKFDEFTKNEIELGRDEKVAVSRALRLTELFFKKGSIGGPTSTIRMIILGMKEPMDSANRDRQRSIEMWDSNPSKAMQEGYTSDEGVPLDMKKDFGAKNPNKNFGKPLKPNWMRIIFGFDLKTKKETTFILKGSQAQNMEIPYFKVVELNGKFNEKTGIHNGTKSTRINIVEDDSLTKAEKELVHIEKLVQKHLKGLCKSIGGIEEWCTIHGNKDVLITEADVIEVDMELNGGGSRTIVLDNDTDYGQRMFVPTHVPIDFGEMSRIICFAGAKPGKEDYGPTMTAMGLYPIPEYSYEPEAVESADNMIDYEAIQDERQPEEEDDTEPVDISGDVNEEPSDDINEPSADETVMKTATPALILKVISGSDEMTEQQICNSAQENGFSKESSHDAIKQLLDVGEITTINGMLVISKDEDTCSVWD